MRFLSDVDRKTFFAASAVVPASISSVEVEGLPFIGETLSAKVAWDGTEAQPSYQWFRNGVAIGGALGATFVPTLSGNHTVQLTVTATGQTPAVQMSAPFEVLDDPPLRTGSLNAVHLFVGDPTATRDAGAALSGVNLTLAAQYNQGASLPTGLSMDGAGLVTVLGTTAIARGAFRALATNSGGTDGVGFSVWVQPLTVPLFDVDSSDIYNLVVTPDNSRDLLTAETNGTPILVQQAAFRDCVPLSIAGNATFDRVDFRGLSVTNGATTTLAFRLKDGNAGQARFTLKDGIGDEHLFTYTFATNSLTETGPTLGTSSAKRFFNDLDGTKFVLFEMTWTRTMTDLRVGIGTGLADDTKNILGYTVAVRPFQDPLLPWGINRGLALWELGEGDAGSRALVSGTEFNSVAMSRRWKWTLSAPPSILDVTPAPGGDGFGPDARVTIKPEWITDAGGRTLTVEVRGYANPDATGASVTVVAGNGLTIPAMAVAPLALTNWIVVAKPGTPGLGVPDDANGAVATLAAAKAAPMATIQAAINKIEATNVAPGSAIVVYDGTYSESVTVPATASGTATAPIFLVARNRDLAVISGSTVSSAVQLNSLLYWEMHNFRVVGNASGAADNACLKLVQAAAIPPKQFLKINGNVFRPTTGRDVVKGGNSDTVEFQGNDIDCGAAGVTQEAAVDLVSAKRWSVLKNTVRGTCDEGIVQKTISIGCLVEDNDIDITVQEGFGSAIRLGGFGFSVEGRNLPVAAADDWKWRSSQGAIVRNNRAKASGSRAIYVTGANNALIELNDCIAATRAIEITHGKQGFALDQSQTPPANLDDFIFVDPADNRFFQLSGPSIEGGSDGVTVQNNKAPAGVSTVLLITDSATYAPKTNGTGHTNTGWTVAPDPGPATNNRGHTFYDHLAIYTYLAIT